MEGRSNPRRAHRLIGWLQFHPILELQQAVDVTATRASGFARWQPPMQTPPPSSSLSRRAGRQPSGREWGSRCFFAPPEGSRLHLSLFRCVDLSEEHAGAPGCILLAAKTAIVMELSAGNTKVLRMAWVARALPDERQGARP